MIISGSFSLSLFLRLVRNNLALLCGMSGYLSFIDEFIATRIGQWQIADSGCFAYFEGTLSSDDVSAKTERKFKREANRLNGNCSDHMTGLAAAAYGLFAKISIHFYANDDWKIERFSFVLLCNVYSHLSNKSVLFKWEKM